MTSGPNNSSQPIQMPGAPRIKVIGVGSGGVRAVDGMIAAGFSGVDFVVADTDARLLQSSAAKVKLFLDLQSWEGLGIRSDVETARLCATAHTEQIVSALKGSDAVFIIAALGGGTGTGASSVIAAIAQSLGVLTLAAVAMPLRSGGERPTSQAESGVQELLQQVDAMVIVPADKLLRRADPSDATSGPPTPEEALDAYILSGLMLGQAIQGIPGLISAPGLVNHDFLELRKTVAGTGKISMGIASRSGDRRAIDAAIAALASPLLRAGSLQAARVVMVNITGSKSLRIDEVNQVLTKIQASANPSANILCGAVLDDNLEGDVRVTLMAAGFPDLPDDQVQPQFALQFVPTTQPASTTKLADRTPETSFVPVAQPATQPQYIRQESQKESAAHAASDESQRDVPASRLWTAQEAEQLSTQTAFPAAAIVVSSKDTRIQQVKQAALAAYSAAERPEDNDSPDQDSASFGQILRKRFRAALAGAIRPLGNR